MQNEFDFTKLNSKLDKHGGLYVYRDEFRVLPYGRSNADFLDFEERRTRGAGYYYFSYRRMFGYIELKRETNPNLKDKSSREGLINNVQYRTFRKDAIGLFIELAKDYFRTVPQFSLFRNKQEEIKEQNTAIKADKEREKAEKIAFSKSLNEYPKKLENYRKKYESLLITLENRLKEIEVTYSEIEEVLADLHKLELEQDSLIPSIPKRYEPTELQLERLYKYQNQFNDFLSSIEPIKKELNVKAFEILEIRDLKLNFVKKFNTYISSLEEKINERRNNLNTSFHLLLDEFNDRSNRIIQPLTEEKEQTIDQITYKEHISQLLEIIEKKYHALLQEAEKTIFPLVDHISKLSFDIDEEQLQGAYKAQYEQMKYQWEQTRDTAQLGIAVEIIDHEFNQLYAKINNQLNFLNKIEPVNSVKEFKFLKRNFKQLEDKYALLSPLYRISGALIKEISCYSIYEYLVEFFESQIMEYDIKFNVSDGFKNHFITIKEPVIHTVFINIINNAIYWMRNSEERIIELDYRAKTEELIIANSGDKIPDFRLDKIFDLFYSQKPGGRGIGLYLSKQSLSEAGFDIYATNNKDYNTLDGACFIINKK